MTDYSVGGEIGSRYRRVRADLLTVNDPRVEPCPMSGCWLWTGTLSHKGYGTLEIGGRCWQAHRAMWTNLVGPIPDGMVLDHLCRVRSCCNPDHLRVVTPRVNSLENSIGPSAIHAAKTCCPKCQGPYYVDTLGRRQCAPCRAEYKKAWGRLPKTPEQRRRAVEKQRRYMARKKLGGSFGL